MRVEISFTVNGQQHDLDVEPRRLLVHVLRDELGYTGVNIGCETSLCGACSLIVDGDVVKSCTFFAVQADGSEIMTIAGLGQSDELHPMQESFQEEHGLQCGYCTPGMILTGYWLAKHRPELDREEIREGLEGNLCRCTGYQNIVDAVEVGASKMESEK